MTSVNTVLEKEELQGRPLDEGLFSLLQSSSRIKGILFL